MNDKETRSCWYRTESLEDGRLYLSGWKEGQFHAWSTSHDEYEAGPGHWPAAIIEDEKTGAVVVTNAGYVHFGIDPEVKP